jgi:hypothetical protein
MSRRFFVNATVAAVVLIGGLPAQAQDEGIKVEIDKITCREMLKMGADERAFTMIFMHGFISGKKDELVFDAPALTAATDAVLDACIDNPDQTLLGMFGKVRQ